MKTTTISGPGKMKKETAQGFVEFALAVPILLLVLYGLLEVGRLLFIYSSVVTAARQAVRYGAVTGVSDGGYPRYQDCLGIRDAAQHVGFISEFQDSAINITFDTGPETTPYATCDGVDFLAVEPASGDRLLVSVSANFVPIVPLVPLKPMTIQSSSSRTILRNINIKTDVDELGWDGEDHAVYTVKSGDTLSSIALTFGTTVEKIMELNGLTDTNIFVGQTLLIPGVYVASPTPTNTNTPSPTATYTPTQIPTDTPTPLNSPTPSNTPTETFTPTVTFTPLPPTMTFTPTQTGTPTFTPSPTATPIQCFISHAGVSITQNKMLLTVHNDSDYTITIKSVTIFYDSTSPTGQGLTAIYAGGTLIWDDFAAGSPVTISNFLTEQQIAPRGSTALKFFFEKNIRITGMENMMISFVENGCPIHETAP